jgi:ubiquitin-activating enzyme E1
MLCGFGDWKLMFANRLSELVETISRKKIPGHQQNIILEVTADDTTDEDVEIPYVMVKLK